MKSNFLSNVAKEKELNINVQRNRNRIGCKEKGKEEKSKTLKKKLIKVSKYRFNIEKCRNKREKLDNITNFVN